MSILSAPCDSDLGFLAGGLVEEVDGLGGEPVTSTLHPSANPVLSTGWALTKVDVACRCARAETAAPAMRHMELVKLV